jgi:plastocyanin
MFSKLISLFTLVLLLSAAPVWCNNINVSVGGQTSGGYDYGGTTPVLSFSPADITINAGDTVTFINNGGTHNVTSDTAGLFRCANGCDGSGGNGNLSGAAWTATVAFNTPGRFGFHCEQHQSMGMVGSITVNAVASTFAITPGIAGSWYNSTQSGHGFNLEVLPGNILLGYWYVFDGAGNNLWLGGVGSYTGNTATLNLTQLGGGLFPPNFDPTHITRTPWGTLTLTFTDCNTGTAAWAPTVAGFTPGSLAITRLTSVGGLACP